MSKLAHSHQPTMDALEVERAKAELGIMTEFVHPAIPIRQFDWRATYRSYEPGDPMGHGSTEAEAIKDLLAQDEPPNRHVAEPFRDILNTFGKGTP